MKMVVRRTIFGKIDCFSVMLSADSSSVSPGQFPSIGRVMLFCFLVRCVNFVTKPLVWYW